MPIPLFGFLELSSSDQSNFALNSSSANLTNAVGNHLSGRLGMNNKQVARKTHPSPKKNTTSRSFRKLFARTTGFHGFFSQKYKSDTTEQQKRPPRPAFVSEQMNGTSTQVARDLSAVLGDQRPPPQSGNRTRMPTPGQQGPNISRQTPDHPRHRNDPPGHVATQNAPTDR